jgi:prepilin-type N-terminal cleavage/methylation domain-containing protein
MHSARRKAAAPCRGGRVGRRKGCEISCVVGDESCVAGDTPASTSAFTIVEVLVVLAIILVLAGLVLAASSYVHNKGARSRAEAEIAAISAALENYKADNGIYLSNTSTNSLDPKTAFDATAPAYLAASAALYTALTGDTNGDGAPDGGAKFYIAFKPNQLGGSGVATYVKDPFGNSYGYSTAYQADLNATPPVNPPTHGYNPTFDLWSTASSTTPAQWVKNW